MPFRQSFRVIVTLISLLFATQLFADSDFSVSKIGPGSAAADTDVAYDVQIFNAGPDDADVTLTDTMPPGLTFVSVVQNSGTPLSCSDPGVGNNGTITCNTATMPGSSGADFTITMHIPPQTPDGTVYTNVATVSTGGIDPNDENNSAAAATEVGSSADAGILKNGPNVATPGSNVAYTITVTNSGPGDAQNVVWTDTLPGTMTFVSFTQDSGPAFSCTPGATTTCSLTPMLNGAVATFTLTGNIPSNTPAGTSFTNSANLESSNDPSSENNVAVSSLTVSSTDLSVTKSGPSSVTAGQQITYTIGAANAGPDTATNVHLNDPLPPGTTFVSFVQNTGPAFACSIPGGGQTGTVDCVINSFGSGLSATFTLIVTVSSTVADGTVVTNTATLSGDTADPDSNNNTASANTSVIGVTDLSVTKTGPATADAGTNVSYTINVANVAGGAAANAQLTDTIPAGTTFVSFQQTTGPTFSCSGTSTITCTNASFAASATATFTLVVSTTASATGSVSNTANVSTSTTDTNGGNNSSTAVTTLTASADIAVTKSGPATAAAGSDISYLISISNAGPSDAQSVSLTDTIPAATSFVSINQNTGPAFNCSGTTTVTCTIATLAANASATFTLTVHVNSGGSIANTATGSSTTSDPNSANNSSTATTAASLVDLSLTKSISPGPYVVGNPVTFTLVVTNSGTVAATNVVVVDPLPGGMSATGTTPPGACSGTTTVTCTTPTLAAGGTITFTITANLPQLPGSYTNTATASSATTEATPGNNVGSAQFAVVAANAIPALSPELLALLAALLGAVAVIALKK
jgi:uncharacterized repeat protein (TIGR01451 family)